MIEIAQIEYMDPSTHNIGMLRVCSSPDFFSGNEPYQPIILEKLDFEGTLFSKGTTQGDAEISVGTFVLTNIDGALDYLRTYGFDGRAIRIYRPKDKDDTVLNAANLYFTGTIKFPVFSWDKVTFNISNRMEIVNVPMQPIGFLGTNIGTGGLGGLDGSSGLAGTTKPQVWGRVCCAEGALINEFFLLYGFNFDHAGLHKPVFNFYNVWVKGIRYLRDADYHDTTALANATILPGFFGTCLAMGVLRLGSTPASNGRVVADVADMDEPFNTAGQVIERILKANASFVEGVDYNSSGLQTMDDFNQCPVGYYVTDNVVIGEVVNMLADSIGGWFLPDAAGVFQFGIVDLPTQLMQGGNVPVMTLTRRNWLDSIERVPVNDQNENIPAFSVELQHTRNWTPQDSGSLADAVGITDRLFFTNQYRSSRKTNDSIKELHPLAPSLKYTTLLNRQLYYALVNGDFSIPVATAGNGWTATGLGLSTTQGAGFIEVTPSGVVARIEQYFGYNSDVFPGTIEIGFSVAATYTVLMEVRRGLGGGTLIYSETISTSSVDRDYIRSFVLPYGLGSVTGQLTIRFSSVNTSTPFKIGTIFLRTVQQGKPPDEEAQRRLTKESAFTERFTLTVANQFVTDFGLQVGKIVILQDDKRFDLLVGRPYLIIGTQLDDDNYVTELDVWGLGTNVTNS